MASRREATTLAIIVATFLALFYLPLDAPRFQASLYEALALVKWYAREHVILCLVPAFFIAGAITCFVSQASVLRYLGPKAKKTLAYGVASVSGSILAVCQLHGASAFRRDLQARGRARAGLRLSLLRTRHKHPGDSPHGKGAGAGTGHRPGGRSGVLQHRGGPSDAPHIQEGGDRPGRRSRCDLPTPRFHGPSGKTRAYLASMVAILVFANWAKPLSETGAYHAIYSFKVDCDRHRFHRVRVDSGRVVRGAGQEHGDGGCSRDGARDRVQVQSLIPFSAGVAALSIVLWRSQGETREWLDSTWTFTKQILPLLLGGVLVSGALLGRPGHETLIPSRWITGFVGGNSLLANFVASVAGAFMYFATLTEVPILQGLLGAGMGKGPALALLLAGPALSLPSMIVIRSIMGTRKTVVFVGLVCILATITGKIFGTFWG